jgi:7-carboxy-7-deazaguanine synthase (Cx14CxxC type)
MTYSVKEMFYTLQGEGTHAGRPAVFCRFAGCNLWSGREADRATATCNFCDTEFVGTDGTGGGKFDDAATLARAAASFWPAGAQGGRFIVLTGGEPLLQVDDPLIAALQAEGFFVAVETNGTIPPPSRLDWVCVSPKAGAPLTVRSGDELKVVVPQPGLDLEELARLDFGAYLLQPMDGPNVRENTRWAIEACLRDPRWKLSIQTHKVIGIR